MSARWMVLCSIGLLFVGAWGCATVPTPKVLCEKHTEAGDDVGECTKLMEMVRTAVGEEDWEAFATCANEADVGDKDATEACFSPSMEDKLREHFKKEMEKEMNEEEPPES